MNNNSYCWNVFACNIHSRIPSYLRATSYSANNLKHGMCCWFNHERCFLSRWMDQVVLLKWQWKVETTTAPDPGPGIGGGQILEQRRGTKRGTWAPCLARQIAAGQRPTIHRSEAACVRSSKHNGRPGIKIGTAPWSILFLLFVSIKETAWVMVNANNWLNEAFQIFTGGENFSA